MKHAGHVRPSPPSTLTQTSPPHPTRRKMTRLLLLPRRCRSPQGRALRRRPWDGSAALPLGCVSSMTAPGQWRRPWLCIRLVRRWVVGGRWWNGGTLLAKPRGRF